MSKWWQGPAKREPDFEQFLKVLRNECPERPVLFEMFHNEELYRRVTGAEEEIGPHRLRTRAFAALGFDYATCFLPPCGFPQGERAHQGGKSYSANEGGMISDRESFERYPWPEPGQAVHDWLEECAQDLPDGMKTVPMGPGGVLENAIALTGFENLCVLLAMDPDFVQDLFDQIGERLLRYYKLCLEHDSVGAIIGNDDWGFKTQTMLSVDQMRQYVFPWHKKIVQAAHDAGRPAILHSCGHPHRIMDAVIDDIGYDAKHSFEDNIQPIEEAYEQYGPRIALLGGIDVDYVIRSTPEDVHSRARAILERAAGRGGYALGTGNSVPDWVPAEHYFALIAAAFA